jgi:long-chain acyl-CoA synthetase
VNSQSPIATESPLRLRDLYASKRLVVIGGTGFLGKVWWSLLLDRLPEIGKLYLVVRPKPQMTSTERFWKEIAPHPCLKPLQDRYGADYRAFLEDKVIPVDGDITQPYCGLDETLRRELHGNIDAVVNASGIVNFQPPLDVALEVNAFGAQTVVDLARDLGGVAVVHTSTCYVAGYRPGIVEERNPLEHPFPFAGKLERAHWDADREIAECLDIIKQAKQRAGDAFRQSHFLDQAKKNLLERGEPCSGRVLEDEIERVRRRFVETQLSQLGQERAQFWGWPNTYTYTKSIGEQIIARSGLPFTIVRPAIIESCIEYPSVGWNEGVNTSAPIIYAIRQGQQQLPGDSVRLDLIPCDLVASGMLLSLAELFEGTAKPVYQYGTSDSNPVTMSRVYELSGLHKRKLYKSKPSSIGSFLHAHLEGALLKPAAFESYGPKKVAALAKGVASWLENLPDGGLSLSLEPAAVELRKFARKQDNIAKVVGQFIPFTAELDYEFRCDNTRAAFARTLPEERKMLYWQPERLDWRDYFLNTHIPGLDKWVFPELESKLRKPVRALRHHDSLVHLLREMAERHDLGVALQDDSEAGLTRVSFREWQALSTACAERLAKAGVKPGDCVALLAENQANWAIALFGILLAGATAVLLDPHGLPHELGTQVRSATVRCVIHDGHLSGLAHRLFERKNNVSSFELTQICRPGATAMTPNDVSPSQVAVIAFSRGTTSAPRAAHFTHANLTKLLGAIAPLFPISHRDRLLNVLPMVRPMELICGLLLPLSRGARVVFTPEHNTGHVIEVFRSAHITAAVAGPQFWNKLVDGLLQQARGTLRKKWVGVGLNTSLKLKRSVGLEAGPLLLASVHDQLGGHLRLLINTGSVLPDQTQRILTGLGFPVAECYGMAEAGPLAVGSSGARRGRGQVGNAIPGIELRIEEPDVTGLGEVLARGGTIASNCLADSGWLRTGDLGRLDDRGRLTLVARRADAVRAGDGTWMHTELLKDALGNVKDVAEVALVALDDIDSTSATLVVVPERLVPPGELPSWHKQITSSIEVRLASLAPDRRPRQIQVYNAPLPRTADGDVDRRALGETLRAQLADGADVARPSSSTDSLNRHAEGRQSQLRPLRALAQRLVRGSRRGRSTRTVET